MVFMLGFIVSLSPLFLSPWGDEYINNVSALYVDHPSSITFINGNENSKDKEKTNK